MANNGNAMNGNGADEHHDSYEQERTASLETLVNAVSARAIESMQQVRDWIDDSVRVVRQRNDQIAVDIRDFGAMTERLNDVAPIMGDVLKEALADFRVLPPPSAMPQAATLETAPKKQLTGKPEAAAH